MANHPEQSDYGQEDSGTALVPGSLIAYRHFQVDVESGRIAPMNYRADRAAGAWGGQEPYPYPDPLSDGPRTYDADCIKAGPGAYHYRAVRAARYGPHEGSPTVWCTCGFYAHYDPATDFYPAYRWGRLYHQLAGNAGAASMVVVRAVVEVSGTVVMGTLGVRAERMKILAFAIDWEKRIKPSAVDRYNFLMNRVGTNYLTPSEAYRSIMDPSAFDQYEDDDVRDASLVEYVARRYGARYFDRVDAMYDLYPKPDVSALLPAPEPESVEPYFEWDSSPIDFGGVSSVGQVLKDLNLDKQYRNQIHAYMRGFGGTVAYDVGGILPPPQPQRDTIPVGLSRGGGWVADTLILDEIIEWREETPFQRAMRLKKDRPAPPGTGIDRRRGRLR